MKETLELLDELIAEERRAMCNPWNIVNWFTRKHARRWLALCEARMHLTLKIEEAGTFGGMSTEQLPQPAIDLLNSRFWELI